MKVESRVAICIVIAECSGTAQKDVAIELEFPLQIRQTVFMHTETTRAVLYAETSSKISCSTDEVNFRCRLPLQQRLSDKC